MMRLDGVVDMHLHVAPCVDARKQDADEVVREATAAGFKGLVFKAPAFESASIAALVRPRDGSINVAGGVVLNRAVGGLNPDAVEAMFALHTVDGHHPGRVVWMPSRHSEDHLSQYPKADIAPVPLWKEGGKPRDELLEVMSLISEHDAVLATSHLAFEQALRVVKLARRRGIERIILTHAEVGPVALTPAEQKEISDAGALIEHSYAAVFVGANAKEERLRQRHGASFAELVEGIRATGVSRCVLSTDFGAAELDDPVAGMIEYLGRLNAAGFSEEEITVMASENSSALLGWS